MTVSAVARKSISDLTRRRARAVRGRHAGAGGRERRAVRAAGAYEQGDES